jgi:hypothetical protein
MRERPDATLEEIRGHFSGRMKISNTAVCNGMRYLKYRRKKTLNANEQGRPDVAQQRARWRAEQDEMESRGLVFWMKREPKRT